MAAAQAKKIAPRTPTTPVYYDAPKLKAVLLRRRATFEPDSSVQAKLRAGAVPD